MPDPSAQAASARRSPPDHDLAAAFQFNLLTRLGLREGDRLLDVGCGPLRAGRLFIPYLLPERYFGIEPRQEAVEIGLAEKVGADLAAIKRPSFHYSADFDLTHFGQEFDFLLANSIFTHASVDMIRTCLNEAVQVMKPDALFVATFERGTENYAGTQWIAHEHQEPGAPGRVLNLTTYTLNFMRELCESCGLLMDPIEGIHPTGQTWMILRKPWTGSFRDLAGTTIRRTYVHAPRVPDWPMRPAEINLGAW